jgi:hypothetical protein
VHGARCTANAATLITARNAEIAVRRCRNQIPGLDLASKKALTMSRFSTVKSSLRSPICHARAGRSTKFEARNKSEAPKLTASLEVVTPVPGFCRDRVTGIPTFCKCSKNTDSGPFNKPFETLMVPSLSRDFRPNDAQNALITFYETIKTLTKQTGRFLVCFCSEGWSFEFRFCFGFRYSNFVFMAYGGGFEP